MPSTIPMKRTLGEDSENEVSSAMDESATEKKRNRRPNSKETALVSQATIHCQSSSPSAEARTLWTSGGNWIIEESDVLSELDGAAAEMIEIARAVKGESQALKMEIKALREELKTIKGESKALKEELAMATKSRDEVLDELTETKKIVNLSEIHAKTYKIGYKSAANDLGEAKIRLRDTRAQNNRFLQEKQKAEKSSCRDQENRAEKAEEVMERLQGEIATERARVSEFELRYGVIIL